LEAAALLAANTNNQPAKAAPLGKVSNSSGKASHPAAMSLGS